MKRRKRRGQKTREERGKEHRQAELGAATSTLQDEFYEYLIDVDGVYRSVKVAQQYKSQVQSIIRTYKMKLTDSDPKKNMNTKTSLVFICC